MNHKLNRKINPGTILPNNYIKKEEKKAVKRNKYLEHISDEELDILELLAKKATKEIYNDDIE